MNMKVRKGRSNRGRYKESPLLSIIVAGRSFLILCFMILMVTLMETL